MHAFVAWLKLNIFQRFPLLVSLFPLNGAVPGPKRGLLCIVKLGFAIPEAVDIDAGKGLNATPWGLTSLV